MPSVAYISTSGEMVIQPDGMTIGAFNIESASGNFINNAMFPPHGLIPMMDTATRKAWLTLPQNALIGDFSLGAIALPRMSQTAALSDFSFNGSGGFGTGTLIFDLVYVIPEPATCTHCGLLMLGLLVRRYRRD
jgi:hypothetical protein